MPAATTAFAFGPVPSRRLGQSLGVNQIPVKACSYACVYCQVGRTTHLTAARRVFYDPEDVVEEVRGRIQQAREAGERIDYVTVVPDGEPTLDRNLEREIALLKDLGLPVGIITNASLVWREDVRAALGRADWVSLKVDAVTPAVWRRINRPHRSLRLPAILDGLRRFAGTFPGILVTETMLVRGLNDLEEEAAALAGFLGEIHPRTAYLSVPTRPPALKTARGPETAAFNRVYQRLAERLPHVECLIGYEGNAFAFTGDAARDLLGVTAVHPMRREAVQALLHRAQAPWAVVEGLLARGELVETPYGGHLYYVRRLPELGGVDIPLTQGR